MTLELSQIATLRRVLEIFCARHDLRFADRPAIIAARELMKFASEGENDPAILEQRLDDAMRAYHRHAPLASRATASMRASSAPQQ